MRNSDWTITWDPLGTPLVLLALDDVMDSEIRLGGQQLVGSGLSDFALRAVAISRQNRKATLEFTRRQSRYDAASAWLACATALIATPWGLKKTLRITPRGGSARDYTAAVLSCTHRPAHDDGLIESVHSYSFRIVPL